MSNPLDKLKKLKNRSWTELRTRGEQTFAAYAEQIGLSGKMPDDEEFTDLFETEKLDGEAPNAENLYKKFIENSRKSFFAAFDEPTLTINLFNKLFGTKSANFFIEKAEKILAGKYDFLGYENLDFGTPPDWHFEPLSEKRSPLKHWKKFDELDAAETGDKKIVWELNRQQYFFTLGTAFLLTKDERFAEAFVGHLESWMQNNAPGIGVNWLSSLEVAFRAMSWIWAFNFFKDSSQVTPELFYRSLKFLYLHGVHIEKYLSTYYSPNTHITGEALGLYYLGTQLPFFKRAARWQTLGNDILMSELDRQILADGVYFEQTTWYQKYTADFYTHFLILKSLQETADDTRETEKLREKLQSVLDFLMYVTLPDGSTPLIGDDDGGRALPLTDDAPTDFRGSLAVGAVLFGRADYKFVGEELKQEVLWLLGAKGVDSYEKIAAAKPAKSSVGFEAGGYYILRDGWAKTDNYLLIDCGEIGSLSGGHGHADTLSIELAVRGKKTLTDSGTYTYHESKEMRDYFRSSFAHNSLVIDDKSSSAPNGKFNWKNRANARAETWISDERFDFFKGSHDGYDSYGAIHQRSVLFLKNEYWILRDFVKASAKHKYSLNFHFPPEAQARIEKVSGAGSFISDNLQDGAENCRIFTFGDNGDWSQNFLPVSDFYGRKKEAAFVQFISEGTGAQEFFTFIIPSEKDAPNPQILETPILNGRAFVVKYLNYSDLFVFADSGENEIRTEFFSSNFRFLWARLSPNEELPEEFVMIDGSKFALGNRSIIDHPQKVSFAVARRLGKKVNVKTNEGLFSVSVSRKKPTKFVLKG